MPFLGEQFRCHDTATSVDVTAIEQQLERVVDGTTQLISAFVFAHGLYNPSTALIQNFNLLTIFCG